VTIPAELIELFSEFERRQVRYLLVGGHAVSAHGKPRSTKDVDLWLAAETANVSLACDALKAFGVPPALVEALRNAKPEEIVWLGRPPSRIDLLQALPGLEFEPAWERRLDLEIDGVLVRVLGKDDLVHNKRTVGTAGPAGRAGTDAFGRSKQPPEESKEVNGGPQRSSG
jgi:hypothetical protein